MLDPCPCVITPNIPSNPTVTSDVTYDGSSLACISFSAGNVNALATAISLAICALQSAIAAITVDTDNTVLININANCLQLQDGQSVTDALNAILTQVCTNTTDIANLDTDNIIADNITTQNCFGITDGMTLTQVINLIISVYCGQIPNVITTSSHFDSRLYKTPLVPYVKSSMVCADTSGGGVAKVTFGALDYYVDDRNVNRISTQVALVSNSDNYIYLDNQNNWVYAVEAVGIGDPIPTTDGVIVVKVQTGVGTVAGITTIIERYPIDETLLQDDSILPRHLASTVVVATGAITQDGTGALQINPDGVGIELSGNKAQLKDDGVKKEKINADVIGDGLKQNANGAIDLNPRYSVATTSGYTQLLNDAATGVSQHYGFDESGSRGMVDDMIYYAELAIDHADILTMGVTDTPLKLITCPAGKSIHIVKTIPCTVSPWTTPYATNTKLIIYTDTATANQSEDQFILLSSVVRGLNSFLQDSNSIADTTSTLYVKNKDVYVGIEAGNPTGGTAGQVLGVRVYYTLT